MADRVFVGDVREAVHEWVVRGTCGWVRWFEVFGYDREEAHGHRLVLLASCPTREAALAAYRLLRTEGKDDC